MALQTRSDAKRADTPSLIPIAAGLASSVVAAAQACGYEEMGILNSEMLFLRACVQPNLPKRIVESGRARGQSTAMLARMFPDAEILSIELDKGTEHDEVAKKRLAGFKNVQLLYGDSLRLMPSLLKDGDVALVDGPKGSLGIELCLRVCATARPSMVFMHDSHHLQLERQFTEAFWPRAFYSDHPAYVEEFRALDEPCWKRMGAASERAWTSPFVREGEAQQSYGPTLACLPTPKIRDAKWMLRELNRLRKRFPRWRR